MKLLRSLKPDFKLKLLSVIVAASLFCVIAPIDIARAQMDPGGGFAQMDPGGGFDDGSGLGGQSKDTVLFFHDEYDQSRWQRVRDIFWPSNQAMPPRATGGNVVSQGDEGEASGGGQLEVKALQTTFIMPRLIGVLSSDGGKISALINGRILKVGETVDGFKLVKISKTSVTLARNRKEYILNVKE